MNKIDLTILFSFRNEKENLPKIFDEVSKLDVVKKKNVELVFISDQSNDGSIDQLKLLRKKHKFVKTKIFSTKVHLGNTRSIILGYKLTSGKCVVYIDADLQDPIHLIDQMYIEWESGIKVVQTKRLSREGENKLKLLVTNFGYFLISRLNPNKLSKQVGEFKLIDREILNFVISSNELNPYLRGLTSIFYENTKTLTYKRLERYSGKTHFSLLHSLNPYLELIKGMQFNNNSFGLRIFLLELLTILLISPLFLINQKITILLICISSLIFFKFNLIVLIQILIDNKSQKYLNVRNIEYLIKEI